MNRVAPLKIAGLEENASPVDGRRHCFGVRCAQSQRLFDKEMFTRLCARQHQWRVTVGFRADNHRGNGCIRPDLGDIGHGDGFQFLRPFFRPRRHMIPDLGHGHIGARLQTFDKAWCMNMAAAHQRDL